MLDFPGSGVRVIGYGKEGKGKGETLEEQQEGKTTKTPLEGVQCL